MKIKILYKEVGMKPSTIEIDNQDLTRMQRLVGGYLEQIPVGNGVYLYCNEEGKIHNLPVNFPLSWDKIRGDVFFARADAAKGDFAGLTEEDINGLRTFLAKADKIMKGTSK